MNMNTHHNSIKGEINEDERKAAIRDWGNKYKKQAKEDDKVEKIPIEQTGFFRNLFTLFSKKQKKTSASMN